MTLPSEELRAIKNTREFLRELLQVKAKDLRVGWIRERVCRLLSHYPWDLHIEARYDDVCECGIDKQWCRCDRASNPTEGDPS